MMIRFCFLIPFAVLLVVSNGYSQPITPEVDREYIVEQFKLPGGRMGNNVNAIVQGPNGFMWFGSHGGLHRYDGYEFVTYRAVPGDTLGETTSLTNHYIEGLYWDKNNYLWVCSYPGGVYRFDPNTEIFKHFAFDSLDANAISDPFVTCAIEDGRGTLWIGTAHGLNRYVPETDSFVRYFADPEAAGALHHDDIRSLYVDSQGVLWIGTGAAYFVPDYGALSRYDPDNDSFVNYIHDPEDESSLWSPAVRGLLEDSKGNFWVGTTRGLQQLDRTTGKFAKMSNKRGQPFAPGAGDRLNPAVYGLHEDRSGGVWVGTIMEPSYPTHLLRYDPKSGNTQVFPVKTSAWQICESSDGTLWIAGAGVSSTVLKITPRAATYNLSRGRSIEYDFRQSETYAKYSKADELNVTFGPFNLAVDERTGNIWTQWVLAIGNSILEVGNENNIPFLAEFNPDTRTTKFYYIPGIELDQDSGSPAAMFGVAGMFVDEGGNIWGSYPSETVGVFKYNPNTGVTVNYQHDPNNSNSISSNEIVTLFMDSRGEFWAATFNDGLNRLNPETGNITRFHFNPGTDEDIDSPIAIMENLDGNIWVAGELMSANFESFIAVIDPSTDEVSRIPIPQSQTTFKSIKSMAVHQRSGTVAVVFLDNRVALYMPNLGTFEFIENFPIKSVGGVLSDPEDFFLAYDTDENTFVKFGVSSNYFVFKGTDIAAIPERTGVVSGDQVYLPDGYGWAQIDTKAIKPETVTTSTRIQLVDLFVNGEKQKPGQNSLVKEQLWTLTDLSLPSGAESFSMRFSDFDFQNTSPGFQFRLVPYEGTWKESRNSPLANYFKVPAGEYEFQVRSSKSNLKVQEARLKIHILPPWYQTWWAYSLYVIIFGLGVFGVHTFQKERTIRNEQEKIKDRELAQAKKIEEAYEELKNTQEQLIHSEKMASLGELTAGIAHEIQNPLNFVNNFSDVNKELSHELIEELEKGNAEEAMEIARGMAENEEKIVHHGKRAEEIVKSMLQHSRGSSGEKETTNINDLTDEYLRLAYHGMRAKDKSFNASMNTEFDSKVGEIDVVPQDIGRVVLNLITNAFYAVSERADAHENGYEPTVSVSTSSKDQSIEIKVSDNGTGISQENINKIFEPFFSTKGARQGTGLGLSLSYDIIKKGHGGDIKVDSKEGEGSEFTIFLPKQTPTPTPTT